MLRIEPFLESDSKFRSKLSHQNITDVTISRVFSYIDNVCEDLIKPSATPAFEVLVRLLCQVERSVSPNVNFVLVASFV